MGKKKPKKKAEPKKPKFSIYFDPLNPKDAVELSLLEFCRIKSKLIKDNGKPIGMGKFIRILAVEFARQLEQAAINENNKKESENEALAMAADDGRTE